MRLTPVRRKLRAVGRRVREARMFARAIQSETHPIAAHIVPTRRCNLACAYCNEFDHTSAPVPTGEMVRRIDHLARLGTTIVTLSGGEPLLHPDAESLVRRIRTRGMMAVVITNGFPLTPARIRRLNDAGLDQLQLSIDNVSPDEVSKKSLALLDKRLGWLAEEAEFDVSINAVLGSGVRNPDDALAVAERARALGFRTTVGIIHDGDGRLRPLDARERAILDGTTRLDRPVFSFDRYNRFQENLAKGLPNQWHCRAGCRYLYVCEDGLVHYCSQQRGRPGLPLDGYTPDDLARESAAVKACAPFCTVGCVHRVAMLDDLRERPLETLNAWFGADQDPARMPLPVRVLVRLLVTGRGRRFAHAVARRLLGGRPD